PVAPVIEALWRARTPEDFADYLIAAIKNDGFEYASFSPRFRARAAAAKTVAAVKRLFAGMRLDARIKARRGVKLVWPVGEFYFVGSERKPSSRVRFSLRQVFTKTRAGWKPLAGPAVFLNSPLSVGVTAREWIESSRLLGWRNAVNPRGTALFRQVGLPFFFFKRWKPFLSLETTNRKAGAPIVALRISDEKLEELQKWCFAANALHGFTTILRGGATTDYLKTLRSRKNRGNRLSPTAFFLATHKRDSLLFQKIIKIMRSRHPGTRCKPVSKEEENAVEQAIIKHFGLEPCPFTKRLARSTTALFNQRRYSSAARRLKKKVDYWASIVRRQEKEWAVTRWCRLRRRLIEEAERGVEEP
ncbi:MAG: hypothetical protein QW343_02175, partial [Candidatus Norongarragalinales archaeon]